jgi:glycosyltransferase involved in cell wall biosynthesis
LPVRAHFVNENLGGHATLHLHLRRALAAHPDIEASFFDAPPPTRLHRLLRAEIPGLARLDLDLAPLRDQLLRSAVVERHLRTVRDDIDVLHVYTHNTALLSAATLRQIPTVVSLDVTNRDNAYRLPQRPPTRFTGLGLRPLVALERRIYRSAGAIVTHSRWAADSVASYGIDPAAIQVIPFGIAVGPLTEGRRDGGTPRIVFVGNTLRRKGGWRLVDLWRRHLADRSRLVLVTREPVPPEPGLEVRNDIRPGDGQLDALLSSVDVFALPSMVDSSPFAVLEAMAAALPVVAYGQGGIPEMVDDGRSGLLVPAGDEDALVAALSTLVADGSARQEMGRAGRRLVEDHFDVDLTTAALVEVLRSVI